MTKKLSAKALRYLRIIGNTEDASITLTKGFAKAADELKSNGFAVYISLSQGGCHVALTQEGIDFLDGLEPSI